MRRIRYSVAMSLDGYIAGPKGEFDWIKEDPDFDFSAVFKQFDTIVAGRRTFEPMAAAGRTSMPGMQTIVVSRTLRANGVYGARRFNFPHRLLHRVVQVSAETSDKTAAT